MLDADLAQLYGVSTARLNQQVRRNLARFPPDFMFQLSRGEASNLMLQFATSSLAWGGRRKLPLAFTQEGVAMLSSVLKSRRAIQANVAIMRAFVRLRDTLSVHRNLARKLRELERRIETQDADIRTIFDAIRLLMAPPQEPKPGIGFIAGK